MSVEVKLRRIGRGGIPLTIFTAALFTCLTAAPTFAQVHGVPPSVTSIQLHVPPFLPNIMPSVTSLGPYGIGYRPGPTPPPYGIYPNRTAYGRGRRSGYGSYGYGSAYIAPYYYPIFDDSSGYDSGGGGPYVYSGPPAEQTLHVVVDLPPTRHSPDAVNEDDFARAVPPPAAPADAAPVEPTVLVFRDGHQQQVNNYAIMGQTVYVFDSRTQKISLSDLDVPATIKLNDDRGVEFQLPKAKQADLNPQNLWQPSSSTDVMLQTKN
ncbi:MAG: hypothetical protein WBS19_03060 [Candidatus Korobacteraceae bacterium]